MLNLNIENLLLIDIETVSQYSCFDAVPLNWQQLWSEKISAYLCQEETPDECYNKRAAILAEFGKIVCISVGYFRKESGQNQIRIKSFAGDDEIIILKSFMESLNQWYNIKKSISFCGHNVKEFDLPYICRRLLINQFNIPQYLNFQSMKPWETNIVDTMQFWKFGDYKNYISLNLLAACLGIDSPKTDMDGSKVGDVYWNEKDLQKIVNYCQKDVVTVGQIILKMKGLPILTSDKIVIS